MHRGKKYLNVKKLVDPKKVYPLDEAIDLVKKTSITKFDGTIELTMKLNLDTTKAEQQLRGNIALPHYFGKKVRVLVLDDNLTKEKAHEHHITLFGGSEQITKIKEGWLDFDVIVTTPKFMPELSKLGKILGPKNLMPNPKLGTVTPNPVHVAQDFLKGKYSYRTDTYGNIHVGIAKVSASEKAIKENVEAFINFIKTKRPSTIKGDLIQKIYLCSSMGPSIKVQIN
ncbi:MAG: 50S ribosomal protein L1 [Mycoplasmataceae bacterium]|jgi:large subunit ribosomal protein L1|nr:50S ribosomal protein L1 [Mycoplasmataceae bacterium]